MDAKVVSWNIEHMHDWFSGAGTTVIPSFTGVAQKVATVLKAVKPDILCIQEGPTHKVQLEQFLADFVDSGFTVAAGETGGSQKPYIAFKSFQGLQSTTEIDFSAPEWKYPFLTHSEDTGHYSQKNQSFTRLPVEVLFETTKGTFSVICLHLKSKFSMKASSALSSDPEKRTIAISEGLEQRARILQEATLLRDYVQNHLFKGSVKDRIIIAGDLNDGPGKDFFETRFFSTDVMRRIRGDIDHPDHILTDVVDKVAADKRFTAIFNDRLDKVLRKILLDHLLVTPQFLKTSGLRVNRQSAKVEHTAYLAQNSGDWSKKTKPDRMLYPSDHRPVSVSVKF